MLEMKTHVTAILTLWGFQVSISGDCQVSLFPLILRSGVLTLTKVFICTRVVCAPWMGMGQQVNTGVASAPWMAIGLEILPLIPSRIRNGPLLQ